MKEAVLMLKQERIWYGLKVFIVLMKSKTVVNNVGVPVFYNIYEDSPEHCYQICELEDAGVKMTMNCLTSTLCAAKTLKEIYKEFYLTEQHEM